MLDPQITTVLFDLDGTLANTLASIAYFGNSTAGIRPAGNPGGDL